MKKLFLFFIYLCSLGCFAQSDEQEELFSYKFIEENLLPVDGDPPPPPKYFGMFFVKVENEQIQYIADLYILWCVYTFEYEQKGNKEYSSLTHFLYEVLNFKKKMNREQTYKYGGGVVVNFDDKIKKDYETLSFEKFKKKYIEKKYDTAYIIKRKYNKKDNAILSISYYMYLNRGYIIPDLGPTYIVRFRDKETENRFEK